MNPKDKERFQWFFTAIENSLQKYDWKVEEDGSLGIMFRGADKSAYLGVMFQEQNAVPEFGIMGMATARSLSPLDMQTEFSTQLRDEILRIVFPKVEP